MSAGVRSRKSANPDVALVETLLGETIGGNWRVSRLDDGSTSRSFVAAHGPHRRFVKLDVRTDVLERLSEMGTAPRISAAGVRDGRRYVIQAWVKGESPARSWFADELEAWTDVVAVYQDDAKLAKMLAGAELPAHAYADALARRASKSAASDVARRLRETAATAAGIALVPTHGDPNLSNFLIAAERLYLVDWDDAALSDPMRDIGQLLWWYVPEEHWPRALARLGLAADDEVRERLHWWVAAESLDVSLRLETEDNRPAAHDFLNDAVAALEHRPNPRVRYPADGSVLPRLARSSA